MAVPSHDKNWKPRNGHFSGLQRFIGIRGGISSLPISFFAVVQVKKAGKSEKATSQKTQGGIPKKLATRLGYKKLEKAKQKTYEI